MAVILNNVVRATLSGAITSTATTIVVVSGQGARFPMPTGGDWFPLVLEDEAANIEICRATARNGDAITVQRGQEGTMARAYEVGAACELRLTVGAITAFVAQEVPEDTGGGAPIDTSQLLQRSNNLSDVPNKATARTNLGVYSTSQVDQKITDAAAGGAVDLTAYLKRSDNLSTVGDKAESRTNLGVYSKAEVDGLINTGGGTTTPSHPAFPDNLNSLGAYRVFEHISGMRVYVNGAFVFPPTPIIGMTVSGAHYGSTGTWRVMGETSRKTITNGGDETQDKISLLVVRIA